MPTRRPRERAIYVGRRPSVSQNVSAALGQNPLFAFILVAAIIALVVFGLVSCMTSQASEGPGDASSDSDVSQSNVSGGLQRVSFVAVGDNLLDDEICDYALSCGNGDSYDFTPIYAPIKQLVESADLSYISQETHLGGEELGVHGYPSFNTPDNLAPTLTDTGFDLVALASNHCYDYGYYGALSHAREVWNEQPVAAVGIATSSEEARNIPVVERDGITFAFLDYTYGVNGYEQSDFPSYAINFLDEDRLESDIQRAHQLADVVIVGVHWGTEKVFEPDEEQLEWAQIMADAGADIVLGSHPHVIQPVEWVEGENGNSTLVVYGLGDFKSNHATPNLSSELSGMLSCDFVRQDNGDVTIENVKWIPLVNHIEEGAHAVYPLSDYTEELASRHALLSTIEDPIAKLRALTEETVNARGANLPIA